MDASALNEEEEAASFAACACVTTLQRDVTTDCACGARKCSTTDNNEDHRRPAG